MNHVERLKAISSILDVVENTRMACESPVNKIFYDLCKEEQRVKECVRCSVCTYRKECKYMRV
jgi:hypothetical protein